MRFSSSCCASRWMRTSSISPKRSSRSTTLASTRSRTPSRTLTRPWRSTSCCLTSSCVSSWRSQCVPRSWYSRSGSSWTRIIGIKSNRPSYSSLATRTKQRLWRSFTGSTRTTCWKTGWGHLNSVRRTMRSTFRTSSTRWVRWGHWAWAATPRCSMSQSSQMRWVAVMHRCGTCWAPFRSFIRRRISLSSARSFRSRAT